MDLSQKTKQVGLWITSVWLRLEHTMNRYIQVVTRWPEVHNRWFEINRQAVNKVGFSRVAVQSTFYISAYRFCSIQIRRRDNLSILKSSYGLQRPQLEHNSASSLCHSSEYFLQNSEYFQVIGHLKILIWSCWRNVCLTWLRTLFMNRIFLIPNSSVRSVLSPLFSNLRCEVVAEIWTHYLGKGFSRNLT